MIPVVVGSSPIGHPNSPREAFTAAARSALEKIETNARGTAASDDPEFLHQLRVGLRRLRAALRAFRDLLPAGKRRRLVRALRKLSPLLGRARDWDVLLARVNGDPDAHSRARRAHKAAREAIASRKFFRMLATARTLEAKETKEPLARFAARSLERAHRGLVKKARDIDWKDRARRHAVRIRVKRLRYSCEFFAGAFPAGRTTPYVGALKQLQKILGELNDIAVARRLIGLETDEKRLLRRLDAAWKRFAKRPPFWRAPA